MLIFVLWCIVIVLNEMCMINKSLVVFYIVFEIIKYKRIKEIGLFILFFKFMNFNYINFYVVCYDKVECVVVRIFFKIIRFMCLIIWYICIM